jgi:hypothetical protein
MFICAQLPLNFSASLKKLSYCTKKIVSLFVYVTYRRLFFFELQHIIPMTMPPNSSTSKFKYLWRTVIKVTVITKLGAYSQEMQVVIQWGAYRITATLKLSKRQNHTQHTNCCSGWLCNVVSLFCGNSINYKCMGPMYAGKYLVMQLVKCVWMVLHNVNCVIYTACEVLYTRWKWCCN